MVGDLELTGDALHLPGDDLTLIVYTAAACSPDQEKLDFLTRWIDRPADRPPSTPSTATVADVPKTRESH